ncbi:hypothetical protein ACKKBF_B17950 [Auxenochlorella protothecoides x Auxenochlorella symbiontica]
MSSMAAALSGRTCIPHAPSRAWALRPVAPCSQPRSSRVCVPCRASSGPDERNALQSKLEALKQDPQMQQQLSQAQEALQNPEIQAQMADMMQTMQNPQFIARMAELKEDPDLKPLFEEIKKEGMSGLMKYMNDPVLLSKVGQKLGDLGAGGPAPVAGATAPPAEEAPIRNILDACKAGDLEAVEDYAAVGKGRLQDEEGRCALHYAAAFGRPEVVGLLLEGPDAAFLLACPDGQGMTPIHYAAGYGHPDILAALLEAGGDAGARTGDGRSALDIVRQAPANPVNRREDLVRRLGG